MKVSLEEEMKATRLMRLRMARYLVLRMKGGPLLFYGDGCGRWLSIRFNSMLYRFPTIPLSR
jgi:hypothetical protein